ncbi:acyl-CoA dehydrogenase [Prescottella soli]|uniref:Acyl-CoA dehydrogenase n=1 Tax=Prescottella soli TaxID=1543852 RepID=A0ABW9FWE3_9NOCA
MAIDFTFTEAQSALQAATREQARRILDNVAEQTRYLPTPEERFRATRPAYEQLVAEGLLRKLIPAAVGGEGNGLVDAAIIAEELYAGDASVALTALGSLLGLLPIALAGNPDHTRKTVPLFLSGEGAPLAALCHSEPGGSANFDAPAPAEGVRTTARLDGDEWVINGEKRWVSSATGWDGNGADVLTVVCRTAEDPATPADQALSVLLVPGGADGFVDHGAIDMIGHRAHLAPTFAFDNVRVPAGNVVGAVGIGKALVEGSFAASAALVGIFGVGLMRHAFDYALDFARREHRAGPHPIVDYQAVGYALADAKTAIEAARWLSYRACHALDTLEPAALELAVQAKIFGSETAVTVVTDLMRVVGIESYDTDNPLGRLLQDALALPIFDGGNLGVRRRQLHQLLRAPEYDPLATITTT